MSLITPGMLKGMFPRTYGAIEGLRAYIDGLPLTTAQRDGVKRHIDTIVKTAGEEAISLKDAAGGLAGHLLGSLRRKK